MEFEELKYPEPYQMKDGYFGYVRGNKNEFVRICNFFPYVRSQLIFDDGINQRMRVRVGAFSSDGKAMKTVTVNDERFPSMDWIRQDWGYESNVESGQGIKDKLRHAIQCTAADSEKIFIYETTGWRKIGGEWFFLMPGDDEHTVELKGRCENYSFERKDDLSFDDLISVFEMIYLIAPKEIMFPLMSFTFLSPLNSFLRSAQCEPKTVLMLTGKTGAKKSTLAALMLSFFGRFCASDLPLSFRDTANSIVKQSFNLKDIITCIDDYHPSNGRDTNEMNAKMQTILRAYGNRVGRGRLNSNAEATRDYYPQGNAIITAEFSPDVGESGTARYICLDLKQGDVNNDELTEFQRLAADGILSKVMFHFTEWLKKNWLDDEKKFISFLSGKFETKRAEIRKLAEEKHLSLRDRLTDDLVVLSFGYEFLFDFLTDKHVVQKSAADELKNEFSQVIFSLGIRQQNKTEDDQPTHVFLKKLFSLLDSEKIELLPKDRPDIQPGLHFVGYEDDDFFYFDSSLIHREVRRLCIDQGENFTVTEKGLISALVNEKLLVKDTDGRNTKQIRIGEKKKRFLVVPKEKARRTADENSE